MLSVPQISNAKNRRRSRWKRAPLTDRPLRLCAAFPFPQNRAAQKPTDRSVGFSSIAQARHNAREICINSQIVHAFPGQNVKGWRVKNIFCSRRALQLCESHSIIAALLYLIFYGARPASCGAAGEIAVISCSTACILRVRIVVAALRRYPETASSTNRAPVSGRHPGPSENRSAVLFQNFFAKACPMIVRSITPAQASSPYCARYSSRHRPLALISWACSTPT